MIKGYINIVNKASKGLENIAAIIFFLTAMLIIVNVISRRAFNTPVTGTVDLVLFFTTAVIALSIGYCAVRDGHIAISIFIEKFPKRVQKVIDVIIGSISALFLFLVAWHMVVYAIAMRSSGEVSLTIKWSHFPFVMLLATGFGMLALVVVGKILSLFIKEGEQ
ncbi:TRAP transporter small permease [Halalkalibacter krulwichiae]|uniref:Tripartite ATP-independent periplasmic transporters, DctQ component n=1 Tax=Halalkalibacter krulwichiae TaxID=199441 RepID=A0A1X9M916_9BACI|nr:TRAP transporter small permease [Halalkalibacter krulwichiae]ARK29886.1 Tripartite ATP-independent periplasmic transporters, DctQ component [Halalkalibacter krulwichiae]